MAAPADGGRRCPQQRDRGSLPPRRRAFSCAALLAFCTVALLPLAASMSLTGQEDKSRMTETLSRLSASGKALLKRCEKRVRAAKKRPSPVFKTWMRWDVPALPPSSFSSDLGWVESTGFGIYKARVNEPTCVLLAVKSKDGSLFDKGCLQRAAFMANMTSMPDGIKLYINTEPGDIRLSPEVTYLPNLSMHNVCYVPPHPGQFRLDISLMFTNAFEVQTARIPLLASGFANYTTIVSTEVNIVGGKYFTLYRHRRRLPPCTLKILSESGNTGFWIGSTWMPDACRLKRLAPFSMIQLLNNKSILFLGDSEIRYMYGVFQTFISMRSRMAFLRFLEYHPWHRGSKLEAILPAMQAEANEPPKEPGTNLAMHTPYRLSTGYSIFYGGRWSGFGQQRLRFRAIPRAGPQAALGEGVEVDVNLTFVSFFNPAENLFQKWMVDGSLTGGEKAMPARRKFDFVIEASLLHGVLSFDSPLDYGSALSSNFVPRVKWVCPPATCQFVSFGPLVGQEAWKPWRFVHMSNNVRNFAFEDEAYKVLRQRGLPNVLLMRTLTAPIRGSELAADPAHYRAPVTLAMLDLVFGTLGVNASGPLL